MLVSVGESAPVNQGSRIGQSLSLVLGQWFVLCCSVAQSGPALCNPMNHSTLGLPVHHQLQEFTQTHVHWVGDAIQPSHPLLSPSPPALNLSQHQGLFQWVSSLHQVAKVLEFQLQHQSFEWTPGLIFWDISVIISSSKFLLPFFSPPSGATVMLSLICLMVEGKESACNAGDPGSIPGWGRAPGEGNGYPLQYSCLENLIDRAAWQFAVHGFTKNLTRLSDLTLHTFFTGLYGSITFILFLFWFSN